MSLLNTIGAASIRGFQNPDVVNGPVCLYKITSPAVLAYSAFGYSLDITDDGSRIIIGQPGQGGQIGYAFIYVLSGGTYVLETVLSEGSVNAAFGHSVAISGDGNYCVVGASDLGRIYIYIRSGGSWSLQYSSSGSGDRTGESVCINQDGTYVVYGSPFSTVGSSTQGGRVTILKRTGSSWSSQATWGKSQGNARFGWRVSINDLGDVIIIGFNRSGASAAPTYSKRTGTAWSNPTGTEMRFSPLTGGPMQVSMSNDGQYAIAGVGPVYIYWMNDPLGPTYVGTVSTAVTSTNGLTINYDATKILAKSTYYTGSLATWTSNTVYTFPTANYLGVSNTMTPNALYKLFGIPGETVSGVLGAGAVYIF